MSVEAVRQALERLTGQAAPLNRPVPQSAAEALSDDGGLGFSQFNEILILLGYDRVSREFFQLMVDGSLEYRDGSAIPSLTDLEDNVEAFRQVALLLFGNVKYAFKLLSSDADRLAAELAGQLQFAVEHFEKRHSPIRPIKPIASSETFLLGYLVEAELRERLNKNPGDTPAAALLARRPEIVAIGEYNHECYLASDHLDVYVATSMRRRHEYVAVARFVEQLFTHELLAGLKLRAFDPTQAYCFDRLDKGLAEALMLKRAKCTIYLAQESDTLGKDSELASTLAQGKTVIAYVPEVTGDMAARLLQELAETEPDKSEEQHILEQLRIFRPSAAWEEPKIRRWIEEPSSMPLGEARDRLQFELAAHYDKRARDLKERHPLAIQVNLDSGVANGVLVARTIPQCAELVRRAVLRTLTFYTDEDDKFLRLCEQVSGCIYRVSTKDEMLTNAFWNYYFDPN